MADEAPTSETPPQIAEQTPASVEATIESNSQGGTHSSCNNNDKTCAPTSDGDREKSLEYADELMERGSKAAKDRDYPEAAECYSRALEIRVGHYGELAPECVNAYYKYGCVLLYKAQEEADPLGTVPRKEGESKQASDKDGSVKNAINGESSAASVSSNVVKDGSSNPQDGAPNDVSSGKAQEEDDEESDAEDLAEADEDESDLDLAWKMLDVARAIVEKHSNDTMEKVDILSTLAEVALERDWVKAQEAIPYCQKAISICNSRVQRLMNELNSLSGSTATSAASELDQTGQLSSNGSQSNDSIVDKKAEIETLTGLSDLEQFVSNPTSILSDILGMVSAKARGIIEKNGAPSVISSSQLGIDSSSGDLDSPTVSTAHSNGAAGVTHLGVVGRGVKRVSMNSAMSESSAMKKPALDPTTDKGDGKAS
ncbi:hypothetical protein HYC85_002476 [Camellia sinensis]|uniref:Tetratricopeptide SHNi-TPR domain-containing protein n=1 Tax=Camellia sinensis TaxID=4442 RepID=A0A7J7I9S3_CAMSI|nr:hypothetical protein HYC85_002476 [Camellia sinensis]